MKIETRGLSHFYGRDRVLNEISVVIEPGSFTAIVGESGSGKTTLLSLLSTLLKPSDGVVLYNGSILERHGDIDRFRRENIGFVFQFHYLIPYLTLRENVALGALENGKVDPLLEALGIQKLSSRYSDEVSGGERQRAAIARALVNSPSIVFADEPTGNLDTKNAIGVYELFSRFREMGTGFVVASHDRKIIDYADRVIEMEDGRVKQIS